MFVKMLWHSYRRLVSENNTEIEKKKKAQEMPMDITPECILGIYS